MLARLRLAASVLTGSLVLLAGAAVPAAHAASVPDAAVTATSPDGIFEQDLPAVASADDTAAVELGVKFRSDVPLLVTGVRFYKGAANSGTHVGNLWTSSGTNLASATFSNETATGWQKVKFTTPVAIAANTTYVASYFAPNGGYAFDSGYFAASGRNRGSLHALADGVDGGNGVFAYGASSSFPAGSFQSANYWVDVTTTLGIASPASFTVTAQNVGTASARSMQVAALLRGGTGWTEDSSACSITRGWWLFDGDSGYGSLLYCNYANVAAGASNSVHLSATTTSTDACHDIAVYAGVITWGEYNYANNISKVKVPVAC